jgi:hypothetical protein
MKRFLSSNTLVDHLAEQIDVQKDNDRIPSLPAKVSVSCSDDILKKRSQIIRVNRYLNHQFKRLDKYCEVLRNPLKANSPMDEIMRYRQASWYYWTIGKILMQRSEAFMVLGFNKCLKGWWRKYDHQEVLVILHKLRRKLKYMDPKIHMSRVYIPKADGKRFRPLGVPAKADRILASMLSILLTRALPRDPRQHLFVPRRGLHTAWRWIIDNLEKFDNIYEYDLKGFFNSIYVDHISHVLVSRFQMPGWIVKWLHHANHNLFETLQAPKGVDVSKDVDLAPFNQASKDGAISSLSQVFEPVLKNGKLKLVKKHMKKVLGGSLVMDYESSMRMRKRGIPQGVPWSPILSTSVMPYCNIFGIPGISAADDGLYTWNGKSIEDVQGFINEGKHFPEYETHTSNMTRYTGIEFSDKENSCQYLRRDGRWLTDSLTFLGSTWDFVSGVLRNEEHPQGLPVKGITDEQLKKLVGKTYDPTNKRFDRLNDTVDVHHNSWLTYLKDFRVLARPEDFSESLYFKMKDTDGTEYYSILEDKSARCCEELLEYLTNKNEDRTKKMKYILPHGGLELSIHMAKYWSEKDSRGRHPLPKKRGRKLGQKDKVKRVRRTQEEILRSEGDKAGKGESNRKPSRLSDYKHGITKVWDIFSTAILNRAKRPKDLKDLTERT